MASLEVQPDKTWVRVMRQRLSRMTVARAEMVSFETFQSACVELGSLRLMIFRLEKVLQHVVKRKFMQVSCIGTYLAGNNSSAITVACMGTLKDYITTMLTGHFDVNVFNDLLSKPAVRAAMVMKSPSYR